MNRGELEDGYRDIQARFCAGLEALDGRARLGEDAWTRPGGGGGRTRIIEDGTIVEKAAVNFSAVHGEVPEGLSELTGVAASRFYATGVSIIVHPVNPHAPTFHANLRYLETTPGGGWFGGGADLTPHYLYEEDARYFHRVLAEVCSAHPVADHSAWKRACDEYFYLPHRGEARGVGGLFFDRLMERPDEVWRFQLDLGRGLVDLYLPILERRADTPYGEVERRWQELRRGRYVEFNLVWDRGTRFGLETSGRVESVLASLPPRARWDYDHRPEPGSGEARLVQLLRSPPRSWV